MNDRTILVVDDSDFDRKLLVEALKRKGNFTIVEASTGERCLEALETVSVSLVLMDMLMPGIHGSGVLSEIRKRFSAVELPVIMVTSLSEDSNVVDCLQRGANDYITKPVNFEVALSRIETHLKLSEASREMARLRQNAALNALVTTYSHEINNPLTIAIGCLMAPELTPASKEKLEKELWRIAKIVKKIETAGRDAEVQFTDYTPVAKMMKLT
ncbi:MAG: hybrid sensor histidine kinase/response regulator [Proteobacteria bacterium]|nr:MAG: hybrid sensor histidine kinase/response regulator [Pseudomonadota bacterium]